MTAHVDVQFVADESCALSADEISDWVGRALAAADYSGAGDVSVRIVGSDEIQKLNHDFRGKDRATNVLSFPEGPIQGLPADAESPLGDIVICAAIVEQEARQQGKALRDHWGHMIVHGSLHLLGFDHVQDEDAELMEGLEIEILGAYGITNPYVDSVRESLQET